MHHNAPTDTPLQGVRRILAVKLADLGDLLTVTPALQALRAAYPGAQIDLLVPPQSAALLKGSEYINRILTFDKFPFDRKRGLLNAARLLQTARFMLELRLAHYDAIVLFHHFATRWGTLKFAAVAYATGAGIRAGLDNGRGYFLNLRLKDEGFGALHEVDYWLRLTGLLGADASGGWRPHIPIDEASRNSAEALYKATGRNRANPFIAIHPGAGWYSRARIWPVEGFAAAARGLIDSHDAHILIVGGPDEAEAANALDALLDAPGKVTNVVGKTSITESAALLSMCDLFLGNDSGPMHIAAAVGTPVVAVFGPSNKAAWGPYTAHGEASKHRIVSRDLPCMPCFYRGHSLGLREGCGTRICLTHLSSKPVLRACRESLQAQGFFGVQAQEVVKSEA